MFRNTLHHTISDEQMSEYYQSVLDGSMSEDELGEILNAADDVYYGVPEVVAEVKMTFSRERGLLAQIRPYKG